MYTLLPFEAINPIQSEFARRMLFTRRSDGELDIVDFSLLLSPQGAMSPNPNSSRRKICLNKADAEHQTAKNARHSRTRRLRMLRGNRLLLNCNPNPEILD